MTKDEWAQIENLKKIEELENLQALLRDAQDTFDEVQAEWTFHDSECQRLKKEENDLWAQIETLKEKIGNLLPKS